jgi:hypothetical protein
LPGAKLRHAARAIERLKANGDFTVAVQVGINNRCDTGTEIDEEISQLGTALDNNPRICNALAIGVPTPLSLPDAEKQQISHINERMRAAFSSETWVPPIPSGELRISPADPSGIHLMESSIRFTLDSLVRFTSREMPDFPEDTA